MSDQPTLAEQCRLDYERQAALQREIEAEYERLYGAD